MKRYLSPLVPAFTGTECIVIGAENDPSLLPAALLGTGAGVGATGYTAGSTTLS